MAIVRGRVVHIIGPSPDQGSPPKFEVEYQNGQREIVPLNQMDISEDEKKQLDKTVVDALSGARVRKDSELQEIADKTNLEKIEANQEKPAVAKPATFGPNPGKKTK